MRQLCTLRLLSLVLVGLMQIDCRVHADIAGFGNFSGFTVNQDDASSPPAISPGLIEITSGGNGQSRSLFHNVKQDISRFTAFFTYQVTDGFTSFDFHPAAAFVIQDSAQGVSALGGGSFSYTGISPSVAVSLQLSGSDATSSSASGLYSNGVVGGGSTNTAPVNLLLNNPVEVTLTSDGSTLHERLHDTVTGATFERLYLANIPQIVGSSTAYVGFSAATNNTTTRLQILSDFRFISQVPEPSAAVLVAIGAGTLALWRRKRRRLA